METVQHRLDGQPRNDHGSHAFNTLDLMQLFGQIIETMQHRVITDLIDETRYLETKVGNLMMRSMRQGDPGLPALAGPRGWKLSLYGPINLVRSAVIEHMSSGEQWTKSDSWDEIWRMLPPDTDGILAHARENIHCEVIKPRDIPFLESYLPDLIISATVIPIAWDFDHTSDFLGDDKTKQYLAHLHQSIIDDTDTTRAWKIPIFQFLQV